MWAYKQEVSNMIWSIASANKGVWQSMFMRNGLGGQKHCLFVRELEAIHRCGVEKNVFDQ